MKSKELYADHRRKKLMWRLNMLVVIATLLYAALDRFLGIEVAFYVYLSFLLFAIINAILLKTGYVWLTKIFSLVVFNIMIFLVATSEPYATGMYLHFVTAGTIAMALYGWEQWKGALIFVLISLALDIVTFSFDISIIPFREVDAQQARVFFMLNTFIVVVVCVYTFMLYSKFNYDFEKTLKENEILIRDQNEELLKANSELDRFVYSASHDLRAPLSTLTGLINISESEKDGKQKLAYLNMMKQRIKAMDNFINEIIDYSRNNRLELDGKKINIRQLIEGIIQDLEYMDGFKNINFIWDFPENDGMIVESDEIRLKMIFTNLISNAIKYQNDNIPDRWIRLKGEKVEKVESRIVVKVEDNGIGIKKELQDRIFGMFFRAHEHSTGSGLGLYIARESVQKLGGTISVESEVMKGTSFVISLPVIMPEKESEPEPSISSVNS